MDKRIVLASAGAGKTYYICNDFDDNQRVVIITFTNANVDNIREELNKRFNGVIPDNVIISTFDSFVYNNLIRPFEPLLSFSNVKSEGINVNYQPETNSTKPLYRPKILLEHYMDSNNCYYITRLSKLFMEQEQSLKNMIINRLESFCDAIYFDEFQDYNGNDFKTMKYILEKSKIKVIAVGDIYQSCVTPIRRDGNGSNNPFHKITNTEDLKKLFIKKVLFDTKTLNASRRVAYEVCLFINENLNMKMVSCSESKGKIVNLTTVDSIDSIFKDKKIPKLIWDKKSKIAGMENCINWSYSKGDTYEKTCVILTGTTEEISNWANLKPEIRNRLYVALTRSKGDVFLVKKSDFDKWKSKG